MDDVTRLLSALVAIPSVNPMGRAAVRSRSISKPGWPTIWRRGLASWAFAASASRWRRAATTCWPGTRPPTPGG